MSVDRLENEIRKLKPHEREKLFRRLSIFKGKEEKRRGGSDDPIAKLIGIVEFHLIAQKDLRRTSMEAVHLFKLFIDTSAFVAFVDKKDHLHRTTVGTPTKSETGALAGFPSTS